MSSEEASEFTLATEDATIGPTELAALIARKTNSEPPTTQTIRNHAEKGTISGTKTPAGWRFDRSAADEWVRNVPSPRKGGKRRGAGRKKSQGPRPLTQAASDHDHARRAIRDRMTPDENGVKDPPPPGAMRLIDVLGCTRAELMALVVHGGPDESLLGDAQVRRLREVQELATAQLKLDKERGQLVPVERIATAWAEAIAPIAASVEDLPKRVAQRVANACWPGDEKRATIARVLKHHAVDPAVISAVLGELARPPELPGRVRVMIADEVGRVMSEIAGSPEGIGG